MHESAFFILGFILGVIAAVAVNKFTHSSLLAHYEQVLFSGVSKLDDRVKELEGKPKK